MDVINSKWGVPCPMGEACTNNRPDKCATAYQTALAKERARGEFKEMLINGESRLRVATMVCWGRDDSLILV
jgi:hypothetical protein